MAAKVKIPKRIAGVKVPRKVRKKAKRAIERAGSPVVRELAAAALGAVAQAAADGSIRGRRPTASAGDGDRPDPALRGPTVRVRLGDNKVAEAFRAAALDGLRRFLEGLDEGLRELDASDKADEPARKRPRPSARPASGSE